MTLMHDSNQKADTDEVKAMKKQDCVVKYYPDMIVIDGDVEAIHAEAENILRRFAASSRALLIAEDTGHHIVLRAKEGHA